MRCAKNQPGSGFHVLEYLRYGLHIRERPTGECFAYWGNKNCKTGHAQREDENGANCVKQSAPFVPCMLRDVISSVRHLRNRQT